MRTKLIGALTLLLAPSLAHADSHGCKLILVASLPLNYDLSGVPTVPVTLNTRPTVLVVDTGGAFSMIAEHVINELHPVTHDLSSYYRLVNGAPIKRDATIDDFKLGDSLLHSYKFMISPDGVVGPATLEGTLAPDILASFDVEFDFANNKMNLFSQDHCTGQVVYWTKQWAEIPFRYESGPSINIDATLDGKPFQVTLDTGSAISYMSAYNAKSVFGVDPASLEKSDEDDSGLKIHTLGTHKFSSLDMNGVGIKNLMIEVMSNASLGQAYRPNTMVIGMKELRHFRLFISYKEKVVYLTGANAN